MNKTQLIEVIAKATGNAKTDTADTITTLINTIGESLSKGEDVQIPGFGTFTVRDRAARTGRNPQTGKTIEIAASKAPAFKPGKALKDRVNPA